MEDNKFLTITILILSISIFAGSVVIANSIKNTNEKTGSNNYSASTMYSKGLITEVEAAEYLSLSHENFKDLISTLKLQIEKESSYSTYAIIPFIEIDEIRYFSVKQLDEWIEHNINELMDIKTFKTK